MHHIVSLRSYWSSIIAPLAVLALLTGATQSHATDTYEGAGVLRIPALGIGSATLTNVALTINVPVIGGPKGSNPIGTKDSYQTATNQLLIPAVKFGSNTYYNAVVTVNQLTSIEGASGFDAFDGTNLVVPNVHVIGGRDYHNVTVHVGLVNVAGVRGGMPGVPVDQYDAAKGQLSIGAVQYGTRVYTNVTVNVTSSDVMSVSGYTEKVLYDFQGSATDGGSPWAGLTIDANGNLYGTSGGGGTGPCSNGNAGCGTVFELTPDGSGGYTENVLYSFQGGTDGFAPRGGLTLDASGNLYGTTTLGGSIGAGTVFKLTPNGSGGYTETVLCDFSGVGGYTPMAGVTRDAIGNLYGTTYNGGSTGTGTAFKLAPNGVDGYAVSVIHDFARGTDGYNPDAGLTLDASGNLFGTTFYGGSTDSGIVFELTPNGSGGYTETVVHDFAGGADGSIPIAGLILDPDGNLYGTTAAGGLSACTGGCGTVFKLMPNGGSGGFAHSVLYSFQGGEDGNSPTGVLILSAGGNLYGTTQYDGAGNCGTVFKLTPNEGGGYDEAVLSSFQYLTGGCNPISGLTLAMDASGDLFGTTYYGGSGGLGTVFEIH